MQDAVARGAKILTGGERRPELGANFFEPAVVTDVDHSMELMREETFGPVLAIRAVASADEAVALANDSPFSLSASVWTRDARAARKIASQLRAGSVMINDVASYYGISEAPHGGRGASGWGRTHSRFGFLEMVHVKYIDIDRLPRIAKSLVVRLQRGIGRGRRPVRRGAVRAELEAAHGGAARQQPRSFSPRPDMIPRPASSAQ